MQQSGKFNVIIYEYFRFQNACVGKILSQLTTLFGTANVYNEKETDLEEI
jgi:hypothetical protein